MLGEVPIWVIRPPSSEPKAIGIRKIDGEMPERRANWKAIGIMIASAPMFLTKAESTVTANEQGQLGAHGVDVRRLPLNAGLPPCRSSDAGADQKRAADDDDDVVAEAGRRPSL